MTQSTMSRRSIRWFLAGGALVGMVVAAETEAAAEAAAMPDPPIDTAWQHRHVSFDYTGRTTLYTCSGLEGQVTQILRYLGARKDIKIHAKGCEGSDLPSRFAWVDADFYTLAPAGAADAGPAVKAEWSAARLTPQRPFFNGDGNCELFESMKNVILKNFTLRDFNYRTTCMPHSLSPNGFEIKGNVLKLAAPKPG